MISKVGAGVSKRRLATLGLGLLTCIAAQPAKSADCPGNPDALGTSRTLVVDPKAHPRIGTMQYAETLPLEDREVVLTFDDGPLPRYSNQILETLASHCVKATFFLVGRQAQANPEGVRKVRDGGHTVATHSQSHPTGMHRLSIEAAMQDIDEGIASVSAALGDGSAPAAFFRIPGLARAEGIEDYAASKGLQIWSADFPADDWRPVSSLRVYDLAMQRLEAKGKGILLLHDIQARTVAALPKMLQQLKARGYRIVHVVPATASLPPTPTEAHQWLMHPASETVAISRWPKIPRFAFVNTETLAAPTLSDSYWNDEWPRQALWPRHVPLPLHSAAPMLPAPAQSIFEVPNRLRLAMQAAARRSHHAEQTISAEPAKDGAKLPSDAGASRRTATGKAHIGRIKRAGAVHTAGRGRHGAHPARRALKRLVQVKKGSV